MTSSASAGSFACAGSPAPAPQDGWESLFNGEDLSGWRVKIRGHEVGDNLAAHLEGLRKEMRKAAENLEFEEAARLRDEVKRLEAVDLAVADDPLARQSAVEAAAEEATKTRGRSTAGRAGQRGGNVKRRRKGG